MIAKEHALDRVAAADEVYKNDLAQAESSRRILAERSYDAKEAGATQEQIARRTHLSRQRIAQLLKGDV